jgi:hypothetical protein
MPTVRQSSSASVTLRIPNALLDLIDANAAKHDVTRTSEIVNSLWALHSPTTTMATLPVQGPNYARPVHDPQCTCHTCRPPSKP